MWEQSNKSIRYFLKKIQFSLKTWKNAIEISRAYAPQSPAAVLFNQDVKKKIKWLFIVLMVILLPMITYHGFAWLKIHHPLDEKNFKKDWHQTTQRTEEKSIITAKLDSLKTIGPESIFVSAPVVVKKPEVRKYEYVPMADTSGYLMIVANKAVKSLYVLQRQDTMWRVIREYDIAIGEQEGRKLTAGDRRTPEGQYFIIGRKEKSELASIYGPLAYVLDYPNEEDRRAGRTGQGIWIHGTEPDSLPFETRGCLEMENRQLEDLASLLKNGIGTPVMICSNPDLIEPATAPDYRLCEERRQTILNEQELVVMEFRQLLTTWKTAWESKNIDKYGSFYDTIEFSGQGLGWTDWKERKLRTFGLYDTIAISIENILVTNVGENSMIVKFIQRYRTNVNNIENGKKLSFKKENDFWKITGESTCPKEELLL